MARAYLTIDDVPSANLDKIAAFLEKNGIRAVLFTSDCFTGAFRRSLLDAIGKGFIVGNHSWSHPHFSALSWDECVREIERMEEGLTRLYQEAGVKREYKLFRFPYLDKGGARKADLQRYLREQGFVKLDDSELTSKSYRANGWDSELDTACSYDCAEYLLTESLALSRKFHAPAKALDLSDVLRKMDLPDYESGDTLMEEDDCHIMLLHAHDATEALFPEYWKSIILHTLHRGMRFMRPRFVDAHGNVTG